MSFLSVPAVVSVRTSSIDLRDEIKRARRKPDYDDAPNFVHLKMRLDPFGVMLELSLPILLPPLGKKQERSLRHSCEDVVSRFDDK